MTESYRDYFERKAHELAKLYRYDVTALHQQHNSCCFGSFATTNRAAELKPLYARALDIAHQRQGASS